MKRSLYAATLCIASILSGGAIRADSPEIDRFVLGNGLEVLACRDDATPLARVRVVFKAGAENLEAESAGSLSLLERLVLRGLSASVDERASGPLEWKGYATAESIGFGAVVPSSELDGALASLASVLASPPMDALEEAKEAAALAVRASASDPDAIYEAAVTRRLFSKYPWRRDSAGSEKSIRAATAESLAPIASAYLAPGNAALIVSGRFDPAALRSSVAQRFAGWKDAPAARRTVPAHPKPGVTRPTWLVYPDPSMPEGKGSVELRYRGPDIARDGAASLAADLWSGLVADPNGRFKSAIFKEVPKLSAKDGISAGYVSQREGGTISVSALFEIDPALPAAERARAFKERVRGFELTEMRSDPSYYSQQEYEAARSRLAARRDEEADDPEGRIEALAFWWSAASTDYYLGYPSAIAAAGPKDIASFIDAYVMKNLEVIAIRMNPTDYGRERASLSSSGFETITAANAFWWPK